MRPVIEENQIAVSMKHSYVVVPYPSKHSWSKEIWLVDALLEDPRPLLTIMILKNID
jgi:hypothetical protein